MAEIKLPTGKGALASLGPTDYSKAMDLARLISRPAKPVDPALLSLLYFTGVSEAAGKGASLGESLAGGFKNPATYLAQQAQLERERERNLPLVGLQVASLMKPKQGKPSTIKTGIATGDDGQPLVGDDGKPIFEFTTYDASGKQMSTFNAPDTAGTVVNLGGEKEFAKDQAKSFSTRLNEAIAAGNQSRGNIASMDRMLNMLETIPEGELGVAAGLKLELSKLGKALGLEVDTKNIATKEAFQAQSMELVLAKVEQMKGALSDKELGFLQSMAPGLSTTKDGSRLLIMIAKDRAAKQAEFVRFAENWQGEDGKGYYTSQKNARAMQRDWFKHRDGGKEFNFLDFAKREMTKDIEKTLKANAPAIKAMSKEERSIYNNKLGKQMREKYAIPIIETYY